MNEINVPVGAKTQQAYQIIFNIAQKILCEAKKASREYLQIKYPEFETVEEKVEEGVYYQTFIVKDQEHVVAFDMRQKSISEHKQAAALAG